MTHYDIPKRMAREAIAESNRELEEQHKRGIFADGDINHPKYNGGINYATGKPLTLFGYDTDAFIARQYRK